MHLPKRELVRVLVQSQQLLSSELFQGDPSNSVAKVELAVELAVEQSCARIYHGSCHCTGTCPQQNDQKSHVGNTDRKQDQQNAGSCHVTAATCTGFGHMTAGFGHMAAGTCAGFGHMAAGFGHVTAGTCAGFGHMAARTGHAAGWIEQHSRAGWIDKPLSKSRKVVKTLKKVKQINLASSLTVMDFI